MLVLALARLLLWRRASLFLLSFPVWIVFSFKFQCSGDTKWWLFADDSSSSMQAAGNCCNPLAIKGFVLQFLRFNRFSSSYLKTVRRYTFFSSDWRLRGSCRPFFWALVHYCWPQIHDSHDLGFFFRISFPFLLFPPFLLLAFVPFPMRFLVLSMFY